MGADLTTYVVFGFVGSKKELKKHKVNLHDDKYLPYLEGHTDIIDVLVSCETDIFIFGRLLSSLDSEMDNEIRFIQYQNIPLTGETHRLTELFIQLFGQDVYDTLDNKEPQLMHFNHWY